jgi:hypothetical protein
MQNFDQFGKSKNLMRKGFIESNQPSRHKDEFQTRSGNDGY